MWWFGFPAFLTSIDALSYFKHPNYMENCQSIYDNLGIIPIKTKGILILYGNDIFNKKLLNIKDLKLSIVLLKNWPNMWDNEYD